MCEGLKLCKSKLALMLCGFGVVYSGATLAADWQIKPLVDVVETHSNNIGLVSDAAVASDDYITQIAPSITANANGNRLKLDSGYTLQDIVYANNSSHNRSYNQFHLNANAEPIENLFYLSVNSQRSQQLLSPGAGLAADNLNINSGRNNVTTSRIQPSLKRRLGNHIEFDLSYSEGRVNYDSATVADGRSQEEKFSIGRSHAAATKLEWQLNHSQSRQWAAETLRSGREQSAASVNYALFDHLSLIANGGREDGQISSLTSYKNGAYWSAGLMWRPSPQLSIDVSSGYKNRQASLMWAPGARSSLSVTYLNREVGVRPGHSWTGTLKHSTRKTLWTFSHVEEITTDAVLAIVGYVPVVMLDKSGNPIFNDLGLVQIKQMEMFGVVDENFRRQSSQGSFTYSLRKNDLSLGVNSEQRHYELTGRQSQLHGGYLEWRLHLSGRVSSDVRYTVNKTIGISGSNELDTKILTWSLKRTLGKHITTGVELRTTEVDGGSATLNRSENRLSANVRIAF